MAVELPLYDMLGLRWERRDFSKTFFLKIPIGDTVITSHKRDVRIISVSGHINDSAMNTCKSRGRVYTALKQGHCVR